MARQAKELDAQIYFDEEASVRSDSHRGLSWGRRGEAPVISDSGGRFGLSVISVVTPRGDMRFSFIEGKMVFPANSTPASC